MQDYLCGQACKDAGYCRISTLRLLLVVGELEKCTAKCVPRPLATMLIQQRFHITITLFGTDSRSQPKGYSVVMGCQLQRVSDTYSRPFPCMVTTWNGNLRTHIHYIYITLSFSGQSRTFFSRMTCADVARGDAVRLDSEVLATDPLFFSAESLFHLLSFCRVGGPCLL